MSFLESKINESALNARGSGLVGRVKLLSLMCWRCIESEQDRSWDFPCAWHSRQGTGGTCRDHLETEVRQELGKTEMEAINEARRMLT